MTPSTAPGLKPAASSLPCRSRISSGVSGAAPSGVGLSSCCRTGGGETDVEETDAVKQALLEIYTAVVLKTPYNDFDNH